MYNCLIDVERAGAPKNYLSLTRFTTIISLLTTVTMSKRKLNCVALEKKFEALLEVEKGVRSKGDIARAFGVPANTLSTWIKSAEKIKADYAQGGAARKRQKTALFPDIDDALYLWFRDARTRNIPISGPILRTKAEQLAKDLGHPTFKASDGYITRFKERHSISFRAIVGESRSVNPDQTNGWMSTTLPHILQKYAPKDIFNADETGLFYKLLPNRSLVVKGEVCSGGKLSKDRLTVLPTANMDGSEKLPLLVIGKALKPRCFKGVTTLPCTYVANKKAWMTSALFTDWLQTVDKGFRRQRREVALILDNAPSHPTLKLTNVTLFFLPPNTTSVTQPMDQGIIQSMKTKYRAFLVHKIIHKMDSREDYKVDVLQALRLIRRAWDAVTPATIANCFKKAGFTPPPHPLHHP